MTYLKDYKIINDCLFWSPLEKFTFEQVLKIEAELERKQEELGVNLLHYLDPVHSISGIESYFTNKVLVGFYLRSMI